MVDSTDLHNGRSCLMPSRLQVAKLGDHAHRHQEVHRLHELAYRGLAACGIANAIAGRYEMCAEGPSAYPKRKAMFEKRKARMESETENVNRAPGMLKLRCRCYDSRDGHAVAFRRQVAQSACERIAEPPAWNGFAFKMSYGDRGDSKPPACLLRNRRRAAPAHGRTRALASNRAGG